MKKVLKGYGIISMVIAAIEMTGYLLALRFDLFEDYSNGPFDELIGEGLRWVKGKKAGAKVLCLVAHFIITLIFWPITMPLTFILSKKLKF